ncbi:MAG: hypothetical protein M3237_18930 [Actinomycetota bacterium]|nr:hypothetical protein [Actinomycetota bacterium]
MPDQATEDRWTLGLIALVVGIVSLLAAVLVMGLLWQDEPLRAGVLASIVGTTSAIACFGIQIGGAEARSAQQPAAANDRADHAQSAKTQVRQANAALRARSDDAPAVLEQFRIL